MAWVEGAPCNRNPMAWGTVSLGSFACNSNPHGMAWVTVSSGSFACLRVRRTGTGVHHMPRQAGGIKKIPRTRFHSTP